MKIETINWVMKMLLTFSSTAILLGAFFKLQHFPNGGLILWIGFLSNFVLSSFEINRLRKIITKTDTTDYEHTNR